jgi:hypothetical protein
MDFARKLMPENLCGLFAAPTETESSAQGALTSSESALRLDVVESLIHNSRFDTVFGRDVLRSNHTNPNRARQTLPAPIRKGGGTRHDVFISISEYEPTLKAKAKRTGKSETNF